jgi:serine/threonine protein kinase
MAEIAIGSEFAGHRIDGIAGRGGMGVVYIATHLALNRPVALKLIAPDLAEDEGFRTRFKQESMTAASIDHPNVIPIYHAGEEDGQLYITMRYVEGTDLRAMIAQHGKLHPQQAAEIVAQTAAALDAAHARGLVHRDVKPANVLIAGGAGQAHAYLTDFGLTKHTASKSGMTKTGMFVGTLDYIAPEQLQGGPLDARADVYALGCVLYQSLTGNVPYPRDTEPAKIWAHMSEPPPSIIQASLDLPPQFEEVIVRSMAKDPNDRYLSAGDLGRAALAAAEARSVTRAERSVATGDAAPNAATAVHSVPTSADVPAPPPPTGVQTGPGMAPPPPPSQPAWQPPPPGGGGAPSGRKWLPFALAGGALAIIAVLLVLLLAGGGDDPEPTPAVNTTPTPTATTPADPEAEADIRLGVETTIGALKTKKLDVFCGGLSLRYENAAFGGPGECQKRVRAGQVPEQLKTGNTVETIQVNGDEATATLDNGAKVFLVKGENFWEIDGVG